MIARSISRTFLSFAVGWLFVAIVITPPLHEWEAWMTLVLIFVAWVVGFADNSRYD